jgi:hypothetical protein
MMGLKNRCKEELTGIYGILNEFTSFSLVLFRGMPNKKSTKVILFLYQYIFSEAILKKIS